MPSYHNNILCVTVPELTERCGVSLNTIKTGLKQQRQGISYCWEHHKAGRTVYIHYDSLLERYKTLVREVLCGGIEPGLWIRNREGQTLRRELDRLCSELPGMVDVLPDEIRDLSERGLFTPEDVQRIARGAGWLRLWRKMDVKRARQYGFESVKDVQNELFKRCLNEQQEGYVKFPKPINNERVLDRKAREYANRGLDALVSGCFGNANRDKIGKREHALLMALAGNVLKFSFEDIGMFYNSTAKENGLERLTVSAIKQHLNKPVNKRVWMYARHGKLDVDLLLQPQIWRDDVSRPDALWSLDGTAMQLYYRDEAGRMKSDLYVYFVSDVYSGAIIGHSVAFSETSGLVAEALKNAIDTYGYKPYQLQYDNSSANVSDAIRGLMNNMSRVHFGCKPYSGNSKYIETYIGHFQQRVLHQYKEFKGGNITAKSLNAKANPEVLKELKRNVDALPSESEVITMFGEAVAKWNSRGEKRDAYGFFTGETKAQRYMHAHADRVQLNYFEKATLFMGELSQPYTYGNQGIEITLNRKKRKYIVPDASGIGDFEFNRYYLNEKFTVRLNVLNPAFITLYQHGKLIATAHEKERFAACVADMRKGEDMGTKIKLFQLKKEEYGYEFAISEMERQRLELEKTGLRATGTDGFGWWDMSKDEFNRRESGLEDERNGVTTPNPLKGAMGRETVEVEDARMRALKNW